MLLIYLLLCWFYIFHFTENTGIPRYLKFSKELHKCLLCEWAKRRFLSFPLIFNYYPRGNDENLYHPLEIQIHNPTINQITSSAHLWQFTLTSPPWLWIFPSLLSSYKRTKAPALSLDCFPKAHPGSSAMAMGTQREQPRGEEQHIPVLPLVCYTNSTLGKGCSEEQSHYKPCQLEQSLAQ